MATNIEIKVSEAGFEPAMRQFKRESKPLLRFLRQRARFIPRGEQERQRAKKSRRPETLDIHPLSLCVLQAREEGVVRVPVVPTVPTRGKMVAAAATATTPATVSSHRSEGALIIVEFSPNGGESLFSVLKDNDKELLRFPFGMREPGEFAEDTSIYGAARRECIEETFFGISVDVPEFTEEHRLGEIRVAADHTVHVFLLQVPADTPIHAGEEQEGAYKVPLRLVEKFMERGLFTPTHAAAWALYKRKTGK